MLSVATMSQVYKILSFLFVFSITSTSVDANEHWTALGAASYQQLSRTLFYARLVSQQGITAETLLQGEVAFQLEVVVASKSLSARRWRNLLMEGALINHPSNELSRYTDDLNQTMKKLTLRLKKGDSFEVQYHPINGSRIRLNGFDFGDFKQPKFSLLLLRGWVGNIPLSTEFKRALFSDRSAHVQTQMDSLPLTAERRAMTSSRLSDQATRAKASAYSASVAVKKTPQSISAPQVAKPITVAVAQPERLPEAIAPVVSQPNISPATKGISNDSVTSIAPQSVLSTPPSLSSTPDALVEDVDDITSEDEETVDIMSEELLRVRQDYYRELVRAVTAHKTIPYRAFQRGWKGDVRIEVTINRTGKVLNVTILEPSRYDLFNEQAITAVNKAQPLPEMPAAMQDKQLSFSVPLSYTFMK